MTLALDLTGSLVVVTGISDGGLGSGIASRFSDAGADVALIYRSAADYAGSLADDLASRGAKAGSYRCDLTNEADVVEVFARIEQEMGPGIDHVVNNAGVQPVASLVDMSLAEWEGVVRTNTSSAFLCTREAARHMGSGGSIVHVASIEGHSAAVGHAHYCASKAAILMHARSAAIEYAHQRIRVNSVSPGLIDRPGLEQAWPEGVARWNQAVPVGRLGTAADVGNVCVMLASPLASFISGEDIKVDGGVSALPNW